jgi:hypothetical protein
MISLYIPKQRWLFNNQYDLVDEEDRIVYRHRSNFFRTKRFIVNSNDEVVLRSKTIFGLREKHAISLNNEIIAYVTYKSVFGNGIQVSLEGFSVKVDDWMRFSIFYNLEEVLNITKSDRKDFSHMITVKEEQSNFLIMLMFTIMIMLDKISPSN